MKKLLIIILLLFKFVLNSMPEDIKWERTYDMGIFNNYDLRNTSYNFIAINRLLNDGFSYLMPKDLNPFIDGISKGIFSFSSTYLSMLWSHEMGHFLRAIQVGGTFNIHNMNLPVPYTTADLPSDISLTNESIFVTAGFEVNYLNTRTIQSQFIRQNGIWNEDLAFAFANRLMYPIYTSLIVPIDPTDKNVWIDTAGDPIHYILPVFKNHFNENVFLEDGSVNPELVRLYNEASFFATIFNLLDPQFYRELGASFGNSSKVRTPIFIIGDYSNGWTYGTLFNASPLGYELYMQNYIHLNNKQFGLYIKYGRPFYNLGLGFSMNDFIEYKELKSDIIFDFWHQDIYGFGGSLEFVGKYRLNSTFGINFNIGYKTGGYVLGKQLEEGINLGFGISIYNNKKI